MMPPLRSFDDVDEKERGQKKTDDFRAAYVTELCCRGFILALFQSTTANKIDSEHTRDYKRVLTVCEAKILRVTVKIIEFFSFFFMLISHDFQLKVPKIAKKGT